MSTSLMIHSATDLRLDSVFYENSKSLAFKIETSNAGNFEITVFDLPDAFLDRAIAAFGEPTRWDYHHEPSVYPKEMASLKAENDRLRDRIALLESRTAAEPV